MTCLWPWLCPYTTYSIVVLNPCCSVWYVECWHCGSGGDTHLGGANTGRRGGQAGPGLCDHLHTLIHVPSPAGVRSAASLRTPTLVDTFIIWLWQCLSIVSTVHLVGRIHGNTANVILATFGNVSVQNCSMTMTEAVQYSRQLLMWACQLHLTLLWMPYSMIIVSRISLILLGCYSKCCAAACSLPTVL